MKKNAIIFLILISGCTSLHKTSKYSEVHVNRVLLAEGLQVRHPKLPFSCDPYFTLFVPSFDEPLFSQTLKCLNQIKEGSVTYSYQFKPIPHLEYNDATKTAECMKAVFPTMAVPRELYFVGQEDPEASSWECYAVNMNTDANVFADIGLPWDRFKLKIQFPLSRLLKTPSDLQIWLMVTLLESMRAQMGGNLKASLVPETICKRCYPDTPWYDDQRKLSIPALYWP